MDTDIDGSSLFFLYKLLLKMSGSFPLVGSVFSLFLTIRMMTLPYDVK